MIPNWRSSTDFEEAMTGIFDDLDEYETQICAGEYHGLLAEGAKPECVLDMYLYWSGKSESFTTAMLQEFVDFGLDVNAEYKFAFSSECSESCTLLHFAVERRLFAAMKAALELGADPNHVCSQCKLTPLEGLVMGHKLGDSQWEMYGEGVEILLAHGAEPKMKQWIRDDNIVDADDAELKNPDSELNKFLAAVTFVE